MKRHSTHRAAAACRAAAAAVAAGVLWAAFSTAACAQDGGGAPGPVTLDFADADIAAVARTMATLTGRNVVVDPRVKGLISLSSVAPVTPAQAMQMFAAQLRTQGFALVEKDGIALVLPEAEAKLQSASVSAGPVRAGGGQIVTQIFRLTHESAVDLVPVLRPLISPNNTINVNASTNALVITDYADNLQRIARIVAALDVSEATGIEVVPLKHALASDLAPLVARLTESGGSGGAAGNVNVPAAGGGAAGAVHASAALGSGGGYKTAIIAEPRSNAIILRAANPARLALAKSLIGQLDQPPATRADGSSGNLHVVYLKNADAVKLAVTLRAALAALPGISSTGAQGSTGGSAATSGYAANTAAGAPPSGGASAGLNTGPSINAAANNQPSTGGPIQADPATNSLIISAPDPVYRELRAVIDKLDQRRAQVFVESLIAEVRADKVADFGVQWQAFGRNSNGAGAIGTNYATSRGPNGGNSTNIVDFAAQFFNYGADNWTPSVVPNTGMNLILGTQALGVLANFIQSTGMGNVLSTPTLLTLDNEEAKIIVGQNVPFVTGSYANTGASSTSVNPFQTYERQDVGLTLRVRPQISEDGTIKLVLYQEVSSVVSSTASSSSGPTTSKRAIESSVLVNDGAIVVLGGLLEDQFTSTEDKVPGLGDVPLIGNLFKSRNRSYVKTNLMVFLRPVIVRDAASAENFSLDRYDLMRATQQGSQPDASAVLQINRAPVLPAATPVQQQPSGWVRPAAPGPLIEMPATGEANYEGG